MIAKFVTILALAVAASSLPTVPLKPSAPAHYQFEYSVHDTVSGDIKQQKEARSDDAVHGSYSLVQPDGVHRVVEYTADNEHGFNAIVRYEGTPTQAPVAYAHAPVQKIAYAAPVQKIAYAAPIQKVAYAAPVQKIAYAAPVAKLAYAAPVVKLAYAAPVAKLAYAAPVAKVAYPSATLSHVTFSSPAVSYQH